MPGLRYAIGWGVSQSGRFLRHFLYQGFNEDEQGRQRVRRRVRSGRRRRAADRSTTASARRRATRCSTSTSSFRSICFRSPTARRPIPRPASTDSLLARAERTGTAPKIFHLLTNSEYFNRAGSLVHTDPTGTKDADLPANTRVYMIASAPHGPGPFPPASNRGGGMVGRAALNPLNYSSAGARAVPRARSLGRRGRRAAAERVSDDRRRHADVARPRRLAGGPGFPAAAAAAARVSPELRRRLGEGDRQRRAARGRQAVRGQRAGGRRRRQRARRHPPARHRRAAGDARRLELSRRVDRRARSAGRRDRIVHSVRADHAPTASAPSDPRLSIEERYRSRDEYVGKFAAAALDLVERGYLLAEDVADLLKHAVEHYDWAMLPRGTAGK